MVDKYLCGRAVSAWMLAAAVARGRVDSKSGSRQVTLKTAKFKAWHRARITRSCWKNGKCRRNGETLRVWEKKSNAAPNSRNSHAARYNIVADLPQPPPPSLHPGTPEPIGPEALAHLFPMELIKQAQPPHPFPQPTPNSVSPSDSSPIAHMILILGSNH